MNAARTCDVVVVGGGLCGLSAAYHLEQAGVGFVLLERLGELGGLARTETYDGFSFDHSIHILYTADKYAAALIEKLLGENLTRQMRASFCYSAGVFTEYPYQVNNYGLPPEVIVENIHGLVEAQYAPASAEPAPNFESWIYRTFGKGIAENFMIPYNRRQWAWDLRDMSYAWIAGRVPTPAIKDVLLGALRPPERKYGPNREFWYPAEGGIEALAQSFGDHIPDERLHLGAEITGVDIDTQEALLRDGSSIRYRGLISTIPLPALVGMLSGDVPAGVRDAARGLKHNVVHTVNIGLAGLGLGVEQEMHWVYYPGEDAVFHRISFPHRFSAWMAPAGCASIQAEISESHYRPRNQATLVDETLRDLVAHGLLRPSETRPITAGGRVLVADMTTLDPAYIIYDRCHEENVATILDFLEERNIQSCGRFGEWEYLNMDHSILSGKKAADVLAAAR